jgi:hypothetical protein
MLSYYCLLVVNQVLASDALVLIGTRQVKKRIKRAAGSIT